jgi:filamentous hemagglutinin family protein
MKTVMLMRNDIKILKAALDERPRAGSGRYLCTALVCMAGVLNAAHTQAADLPWGGNLVRGEVRLSRPHVNTLIVHQSSQVAVVDWESFGIGEDHIVDVRQPFSDSVLLNRVTGNQISVIAGTLRAPGSILLVNPNGVHITPTGCVSTGGFLASSLDIDNDDAHLSAAALHRKVDGKMHSTKVAHRGAMSAKGSVVNEGLIQIADGGYVSLAGTRAVHDGLIISRGGHVAISGPGYLRVAGKIDLDRRPAAIVSPMSAASNHAAETAERSCGH